MPLITQNRTAWRVGQRVIRKDSKEEGTILEAGTKIIVKWDGGKTSYLMKLECS